MFHRNAIRQKLADRQAHHLEARVLQDGIAWLRDVFLVACHDASDASEHDSIASRALQLLVCPSENLDSVLFWQALEDRSIPDHLPSFSEELTKEMLGRYEPAYHDGTHPLQLLAEAYGFTMAWHLFLTHISDDPFSEYTQQDLAHTTHKLDFLEKTISITVSSGRSIHESGHNRTPLFLFLSMRLCPIVNSRRLVTSVSDLRPRVLTSWLSFWLKTLQKASVDLNMYGAEESRVFEQYRSLKNSAAALQRCRNPKY